MIVGNYSHRYNRFLVIHGLSPLKTSHSHKHVREWETSDAWVEGHGLDNVSVRLREEPLQRQAR